MVETISPEAEITAHQRGLDAVEDEESQHLRALEWANEVRFRRSDVRFALKERILGVEEVLDDFGVQTMLVIDLVHAAGRCTSRKRHKPSATAVLSALGIQETRTVENLSRRQRDALPEVLAKYGYAPTEEFPPPRRFDEEYIQRYSQALEVAYEIRYGGDTA